MSRSRPEGLRGCPRGCVGGHTAECAALSEIRYLGQVGALDHLAEIGRKLGLPEPDDDHGCEPCDGPLAAFSVYASALDIALTAAPSPAVTEGLNAAVAEARDVRSVLLSKGHPIPGRDGWLWPFEEGDE